MAKELSEKELKEKEERKEVANRRIFWFLIVFIVILLAYIAYQVVLLILK